MKRIVILLLWWASTASAFSSIVILPFSNESDQQKLYWLGEGFAESLSEEMLLQDAYIIQRTERKQAYDELRLPYTGDLSRATMLKIGTRLSTDFLVFGTYTLQGPNLIVEARVIRIATSELSEAIRVTGPLEQLYQMQSQVRDDIKSYFVSQGLIPLEQKMENQTVPLHAYEWYIKGLLEAQDTGKVGFFQRAVEANPGYPRAIFRHALSLFRLQRYRESNESLKRLSAAGLLQAKADFLMGLNHYFAQEFEEAYRKWYALSRTYPVAELYGNMGLALVKKNDLQNAEWYLTQAVTQEPTNQDFYFNLAALLVLKKQDAIAVNYYRDALGLQPDDFQSAYLLAKLLERAGNPVSKKVMIHFQEILPSDQKGKFPEQFNTVLQLLRPSLTLHSREERVYFENARQKMQNERAAYIKTYQLNAKGELEKEAPDKAILEIQKGVVLAPFDWYLHYLWGFALKELDSRSAAVAELQLSLWCRDNVESHIVLAEMYRESEQYADARRHIQEGLALDPKNKKALEIWNKIWDKE